MSHQTDQKVFEAVSECASEKAYFDSLPISNTQYDDLQPLMNNKILPHCHSGFYSRMKLV